MDVEISFGAWLAQRRKELHLTRAGLADRVGCSVSALRKFEGDERRPSAQMAELLAAELQIPIEQHPLFVRIARGELNISRLNAPAAQTAETLKPQRPISNLPSAQASLIGRTHELDQLSQLLSEPACRLLTLLGPGGIGKTRLATEVARAQHPAFADGVFFVPLASVSSIDFIAPTIADAIGLSLFGASDATTQLLSYLRLKATLLVVDNLEHLLEGVDLLTRILQEAPRVKLLVTSRERLGLLSEWAFEIHGLPTPLADQLDRLEDYSATALFLQCARRVHSDFELTPPERPAVVRICQLVEGMPLGIELAAAWVRVLSCREIAQEIGRNLDFLETTARDAPLRHRSLRAAFDHSWKLLTAAEQQALRQLSVFRGGFGRDAAERTAHTSLILLSSLVSKSLVRRSAMDRYDLHELIRQYAESQLQADPLEWDAAHERHSLYYLGLLHDRDASIKSAAQREVVRELTTEIDNVRLAWAWAVSHQKYAEIVATLDCFWTFYDIRGWFPEAIEQLGMVMVEVQSRGDAAQGDAAQGTVAQGTVAHYPSVLGQIQRVLGWFYFRRGNYRQARDIFEQSLTLLRATGDPAQLPAVLISGAVVTYRMGDHQQALQLNDEALALAESLGNIWLAAWALCLHGIISSVLGHYPEAYDYLSRGVTRMRAVGDVHLLAFSLSFFAPVALTLGYYAEAEALLHESLELSGVMSDRWAAASAYTYLGLLAQVRGELDEAQTWLHQGVALFEEIGSRGHLVQPLTYLAEVQVAVGDLSEAKQLFHRALHIAADVQAAPALIDALVGLIALLAQTGYGTVDLLEWLSAVECHAAAGHSALERAAQLRAQLRSQLTPPQIQAMTSSLPIPSLEDVVANALIA